MSELTSPSSAQTLTAFEGTDCFAILRYLKAEHNCLDDLEDKGCIDENRLMGHFLCAQEMANKYSKVAVEYIYVRHLQKGM